MIMGATAEEPVQKTNNTPLAIFLTRIGYNYVWYMSINANSIEIANRNINTKVNCINTATRKSHLSGLVKKIRIIERMVAILSNIVAHVFLFTLSIINIKG